MEELSCDEIILQIRKNNEEAFELLFLMHENYLKRIGINLIYSSKMVDHSSEDIKLTSMKFTKEILEGYEFDKAIFFAYWKIIIVRRLNEVKVLHEKENRIEYTKIQLDESTLSYKFFDSEQSYTDDIYDKKEKYEDNLKRINENFGRITGKILILWSEGYSYAEIAEKLKISSSKVNYEIAKSIKYLKRLNNKKK